MRLRIPYRYRMRLSIPRHSKISLILSLIVLGEVVTMRETFKVGDFVWAKMKRYTPWPGKVSPPPANKSKKMKTGFYWIYFYGTHNYAWIPSYNIKPYLEHREKLQKACNFADFKQAIVEIEKSIQLKGSGVEHLSEDEDDAAADSDGQKDADKSESGSVHDDDAAESDAHEDEPKKTPQKSAKKVTKRKAGTSPTVNKRSRLSQSFGEENGTPYSSGRGVKSYEELLNRPAVEERPDSPVDIRNISESLKRKQIKPSTSRFGFLGLGVIANGIVKNLINSHHRVNLWCDDMKKCQEFKQQADSLKAGLVETYDTPNEIALNSDIIISCVSSAHAALQVVSGNWGVLHDNINIEGRGYVQMTTLPADVMKLIQDSICSRGGRYLEAQLQGTKKDAEEGNLVVLGAGDEGLFNECFSCFSAISKMAFFLGDAGRASKINSVLQVINGIALAGLAEGFALADRAGLKLCDMLEILKITNMKCPLLIDSAQIIVDNDFKDCRYQLQDMQRDLQLALELGHSQQQPLLMTSTANEIFKHGRRLGYDKHDASAVFLRARY